MEKKQITPEIEGSIKSAMDEPLGSIIRQFRLHNSFALRCIRTAGAGGDSRDAYKLCIQTSDFLNPAWLQVLSMANLLSPLRPKP